MKKTASLLIALFLVASFGFAADYGPIIQDLSRFIETETKRLEIPALSIALVDGQRIVWQAGFGMQDPDRGIKATENTVYRPASISKLFTAVAVMHLHEKGALDITAPITKYLPEMTFRDRFNSSQKITLRHLMAHRAGILRESPVGNYFDPTDPGVAATIKSIIGTDLVHPVGAVKKYSNLGPTVAGAIVEKLTGVPFPDHMDKAIFQPLKMRSSSFLRRGELIEKNLAKAFMVGFDGALFPAPYLNLGTIPAGNMYSTVGDLARFMIMLLNGGSVGGTRIVKKATVERMFTIQFPEKGKNADFGLGFFVGKRGQWKTISHAGAVYGFASLFTCLPEKKLGVVVTNTVDCSAGINHKITNRALNLMLGEKPAPEPAAVPEPDLTRYVGKYRGPKHTARVMVKNGALAVNYGGADCALRPVGKDAFVVDCRLSYGTRVTFLRAAAGAISAVKIGSTQYARLLGYRQDDTVSERWKDLVGLYGWPHNVMKIFVRDGQLVCLVEWFYEYPMIESGPLTFLFPDYGLYSNEKLIFEKNADGAVRGAGMANVFFKRL